MNLLAARLTGKLVSTDKFEANMQDTKQRALRYRMVEQSPELAEYLALKAEVESSAFKARKQELQTRKYRDTDEGRKTAFYKKLSGARSMRRYQRALESPAFQAFLAFRESPDFSRIHDKRELLRSSEMRKFNIIFHSSFYKNYTRVLNSNELKQLSELEKEINTPDFQKRNELWADKKRWQHSEEYQKEQRFLLLGKLDDLKFFFSQSEEEVLRVEKFHLTFEELMVSGKNWKPGFGYPAKELRDGHSRTTEHQAFNEGRNTFFVEGRMDIATREETQKALAWDAKKGFVEQLFSYTSDSMNTREAFEQAEGLFMVKARSFGRGHHLVALSTGDNRKPILALYYFNGKTHQAGLFNGQNKQLVDLGGLGRGNFYVYSLMWTKDELVWYINNLEVLRIKNTLSADERFWLAQSFLPIQEKPGAGTLKVNWVRTFSIGEPAPKAEKPTEKPAAKPKATKTATKSSKK